MALAKIQMQRSIKKNSESRNRPIQIWASNFFNKNAETVKLWKNVSSINSIGTIGYPEAEKHTSNESSIFDKN